MTTQRLHSGEKRTHRIAMAIAIGVHAVVGVIAVLILLEDPERQAEERPISIGIEIPVPVAQPPSLPGTEGNTQRAAAAPVLPVPSIPLQAEDIALTDLEVTEETVPAIRKRFSQELLQSMSQEEAFDSLMVLLDEYPEYRETILKKMVAGKGIDRIPDLYVSTGIMDYHKKMEFKTKYEYELMRQYNMDGAYQDPVHGPRAYQKYGLQVNLIEVVSWLVDLIGGKK